MIKHNAKELDDFSKVHNTDDDFDKVIAHYSGKIIIPEIGMGEILEAGCATGVMTKMILEKIPKLSIIEGADHYAKMVKERFGDRVAMHNCLFEDFSEKDTYSEVILANVLHHFKEPVELLKHISSWIKKDGTLHITVPNMTSFHRQLGVAMNVVKDPYETSARNIYGSQFGRYDKALFIKDLETAGFSVQECYGFFFKPFPHEIMHRIDLPSDILDGLFEIGKKYPDLACQLYIKAKK
jgi:2-polyprenyl-3-methyl-5-hydroxy-6-metoxy-1,4-benzoquinol methylase